MTNANGREVSPLRPCEKGTTLATVNKKKSLSVFINGVDNANWPPYRDSSVTRNCGLCVIYIEEMEQREKQEYIN